VPKSDFYVQIIQNLLLIYQSIPLLASINPISQKVVLPFHPREQIWERHFRLNDALIEGLSSENSSLPREKKKRPLPLDGLEKA
jgi:hypothetical protein